MPPVTRRHQRPSRYAEGEHEPSRLTRRNRPAYAVVVPMTHRSTTDIGDRRCAQIASRYLEARSDERCLNGLPTEPTRQAESSYAVFCLKKKNNTIISVIK